MSVYPIVKGSAAQVFDVAELALNTAPAPAVLFNPKLQLAVVDETATKGEPPKAKLLLALLGPGVLSVPPELVKAVQLSRTV